MTARRDSRNVEGSVSIVGESGGGVSLSDPLEALEAQSGRLAIIIEFVAIIIFDCWEIFEAVCLI